MPVMPRISERNRRWLIGALLLGAGLAAMRPWERPSLIGALAQPSPRKAQSPLHTKQAFAELTDLGVGPDGQGLPPEEFVIQEQKALVEGLEARP